MLTLHHGVAFAVLAVTWGSAALGFWAYRRGSAGFAVSTRSRSRRRC